MNNEKPTYFAVIPAFVRYDNDLIPNEKLMYGEITSLASKKGICTAGNEYFAQLYGVHKKTVSNWISHLKTKDYIKVKLIKEKSSEKLLYREIIINGLPIHEITEGYPRNHGGGIHEITEDNNTSNNNIKINNNKLLFTKKYGEFKNVFLSNEELKKLKNRFENYKERIENLSSYKESKGKKYKSDYATILNWARREQPKKETSAERIERRIREEEEKEIG